MYEEYLNERGEEDRERGKKIMKSELQLRIGEEERRNERKMSNYVMTRK